MSDGSHSSLLKAIGETSCGRNKSHHFFWTCLKGGYKGAKRSWSTGLVNKNAFCFVVFFVCDRGGGGGEEEKDAATAKAKTFECSCFLTVTAWPARKHFSRSGLKVFYYLASLKPRSLLSLPASWVRDPKYPPCVNLDWSKKKNNPWSRFLGEADQMAPSVQVE